MFLVKPLIHILLKTSLASICPVYPETSEKLSALMTVDYLQKRAAKGDHQAFENILAKVPDTDTG